MTVAKVWRWMTGRAWAEDTLREFAAKFPGSCPLCAYRRFALYTSGTILPDEAHYCPERQR
mgnify:CR=1 FL=1